MAMCKGISKKEKNNEEWIWVEGYKGTDKDMRCHDYQFEMSKCHDITNGEEIVECQNGFHLCLDLEDVFPHYSVGKGNRFFKVSALVRKSDAEEYGKNYKTSGRVGAYPWIQRRSKLVSKSIIFTRELTVDEILTATGKDTSDWSDDEKQLALRGNISRIDDIRKEKKLVGLGYSIPFANYVVKAGKYEQAFAAGSLEGLGMDMKVYFIMNGLTEGISGWFEKHFDVGYGGYTHANPVVINKDDIISQGTMSMDSINAAFENLSNKG